MKTPRAIPASVLAVLLAAGASLWPTASGAQSPELDFAKGVVMMNQGRTEEAEAAFRRVLEKKPGDQQAMLFLGQVLLGRGDFAGTVEQLRHSLDVRPDAHAVRLDLALALLKARRPAEAEQVLAGAGSTLEDRASWHYYLGYTRFQLERLEEAIEPLEKARALDQGFAAAAGYYLGLIRARRGERQQALDLFRQVMQAEAPGQQIGALAQANLQLLQGSEPAAGKNWSLFAMAGGGYDSNVTLDTRNPANAGAATVLLAAGGQWRPMLGASDGLEVAGKLFRSFHTTSDTSGFDLTDLQAVLGWAHGFSAGHRLHARYLGELQLLDGTEKLGMNGFGLYQHSHTGEAGFLVSESAALATALVYRFRASLFHQDLSDRDNFHHEGMLGQKFLLLEGKYWLELAGGACWEDARLRYYDLWGPLAELHIGWQAASSIKVLLDSGWQYERYLDHDRRDNRILVGASLVVKLSQYLSLSAGWSYTNSISNQDEYSYQRHLASLMILGNM